MAGTPHDLTVLALTDDYVVVDKPVGLASIPEGGQEPVDAQRLAGQVVGSRLWVVHRLDKDVSGVLLFARNAAAHRHACLAFEHRQVRKRYAALARGWLASDWGTIDLPLRVFGSGRTAPDPTGGKPSRTDYRVLARLPGPLTFLEIELHTGRKHQIRAHCNAIGHPLAGDRRYGPRDGTSTWPRLYLHSWSLSLPLPGAQGTLEVESPLPPGPWLTMAH